MIRTVRIQLDRIDALVTADSACIETADLVPVSTRVACE